MRIPRFAVVYATIHKRNIRKFVKGAVPHTAKYFVNLFVNFRTVNKNDLTVYKNWEARSVLTQNLFYFEMILSTFVAHLASVAFKKYLS